MGLRKRDGLFESLACDGAETAEPEVLRHSPDDRFVLHAESQEGQGQSGQFGERGVGMAAHALGRTAMGERTVWPRIRWPEDRAILLRRSGELPVHGTRHHELDGGAGPFHPVGAGDADSKDVLVDRAFRLDDRGDEPTEFRSVVPVVEGVALWRQAERGEVGALVNAGVGRQSGEPGQGQRGRRLSAAGRLTLVSAPSSLAERS